MCGICGIWTVGNLVSGEHKALQTLMILNQFRGMDSTGVFAINEAPKKPDKFLRRGGQLNVQWYKELFDASNFLTTSDEKKIKDKLFSNGKQAIVAHCRSATVGGITAKNAHPFEFDNVIGVHNGTIRKQHKYSKEFETDSEALYALINDIGIDDALQEVEAYDTAYTLVYFDKKSNKLCIIRNGDRPLYIGYSYGTRTILFSSEKRSLEFLKSPESKGISIQDAPPIWQPEPYKLLELDCLGVIEKPTLREVKIKKAVYSYGGSGQGNFTDRKNGGKPSDGTDVTINTKEDVTETNQDIANIFRKNDEIIYEEGVGHVYKSTGERVLSGWSEDEDLPVRSSVPAVVNTTTHGFHQSSLPQSPFVPASYQGVTRLGFNGQRLSKDTFDTILMEGCCLCGMPDDGDETGIEYKIGWATAKRFICESCLTKQSSWVFKNMCQWQNTKVG